jgi:hypothetical protein
LVKGLSFNLEGEEEVITISTRDGYENHRLKSTGDENFFFLIFNFIQQSFDRI